MKKFIAMMMTLAVMATATVLPAAKVAKMHEKLRRAGVTWRDDDE